MTREERKKLESFKSLLNAVANRFNEETKSDLYFPSLSKSDFMALGRKLGISWQAIYGYQRMFKQEIDLKIQPSFRELLEGYSGFRPEKSEDTEYGHFDLLLLIVPEYHINDDDQSDKKLSELMRIHYKQLREDLCLDDFLGIKTIDCMPPETTGEAVELARKNGADMVIWTFYLGNRLAYKFALVDPENFQYDQPQRNGFIEEVLDVPMNLLTGNLLSEPDAMILYIFAIRAYLENDLETAFQYLLKVSALTPDNPFVLSRLAVIKQLDDKYDEATQYYHQVLALEKPESINYYRAAINLSEILTLEEEYSEARQLLQGLPTGPPHHQTNVIKARLWQLALLEHRLEDNDNVEMEKLGLTDLILKEVMEYTPDAEVYMVVNFEKGVRDYRTKALIVSRDIVRPDDEIVSQSGKKSLKLISLKTKVLYQVEVSPKVQSLEAAGIAPLDEFKTVRGPLFLEYAAKRPWILLEETKVPFIAQSLNRARLAIQFKYQGQVIRKDLSCEPKFFYLRASDVFQDNEGAVIPRKAQLEQIEIIKYRHNDDEVFSLFQIPDFFFMSEATLKHIVLNFQLFFTDASPAELRKKTLEFVYQTYGVIHPDHLSF